MYWAKSKLPDARLALFSVFSPSLAITHKSSKSTLPLGNFAFSKATSMFFATTGLNLSCVLAKVSVLASGTVYILQV